jgi:hypothetical protein
LEGGSQSAEENPSSTERICAGNNFICIILIHSARLRNQTLNKPTGNNDTLQNIVLHYYGLHDVISQKKKTLQIHHPILMSYIKYHVQERTVTLLDPMQSVAKSTCLRGGRLLKLFLHSSSSST